MTDLKPNLPPMEHKRKKRSLWWVIITLIVIAILVIALFNPDFLSFIARWKWEQFTLMCVRNV